MKKRMLLLAGAWLILCLTATAQAPKLYDTIYLNPFPGCTVALMGRGMEKLIRDNRFEVTKNAFISDFRASAKDPDFPARSTYVLYLIGADGRRRLKARPDEWGLDADAEILQFNSGLPPYHYALYDLPNRFEYHIYLSRPEDLDRVYELNGSSVLAQALGNRGKELDRYSVLSLRRSDSAWTYTSNRLPRKLVELNVFMGTTLLYSKLGPLLGMEAYLCFPDKYKHLRYRVGLGFEYSVFADYAERTFRNPYYLTNYTLRYDHNVSREKGRERWAGMHIGVYTDPDMPGYSGSLRRTFQYGFQTQLMPFALEWSMLAGRQPSNTGMSFTLKYYF